MTFRLLIANRGEVAVRIIGAARDLGIETVAVYARDDLSSQHLVRADVARPIGNAGNKAYLDIARLVEIAKDTRSMRFTQVTGTSARAPSSPLPARRRDSYSLALPLVSSPCSVTRQRPADSRPD